MLGKQNNNIVYLQWLGVLIHGNDENHNFGFYA